MYPVALLKKEFNSLDVIFHMLLKFRLLEKGISW